MDFSVFSQQGSVGVDDDAGVEALAGFGEFGVADVEADVQFAGAVEEGLGVGVGHGAFEVGVEFLGVGEEPAREESGEGEFGEDDERGFFGGGGFEEGDQALHGVAAGVGFLDAGHLGAGEAEGAGHFLAFSGVVG